MPPRKPPTLANHTLAAMPEEDVTAADVTAADLCVHVVAFQTGPLGLAKLHEMKQEIRCMSDFRGGTGASRSLPSPSPVC